MIRNLAGQSIGAQMISQTDGSNFLSQVTVYVTGDGGMQALGQNGSGLCVHEGNGYHSYTPTATETDYSLIAFTFVGNGAISATIQVIPLTEAEAPGGIQQPATVGGAIQQSALDFVTRALRLIGVLDAIETPEAEDAENGLATLNEMLDNWANQRQTIYYDRIVEVPLVAGQSSYTLGSGGEINIVRPVWIDRVSVVPDLNAVDPLEIPIGRPIDVQRYQQIPLKTARSTYPDRVYWDRNWDSGLSRLHVYPVPTSGGPSTTSTVTLGPLLPHVSVVHFGPSSLEFSDSRVGYEFTTGVKAIRVSALGRWKLSQTTPVQSNHLPHTIYLMSAHGQGNQAAGEILASAVVDLSDPLTQFEQFNYTAIAPITLVPNTTYFLLSQEFDYNGVDPVEYFYLNVPVTSALGGGTIDGGAILPPTGFVSVYSVANITFGPVNLKFQEETVTTTTVTNRGPGLRLYIPQALTGFPDATTRFSFPPGYARAIRYNLAVELAPEYSAKLSPQVLANARSAMADIKRANHAPIEAQFDVALVGRPGRYNVYTDSY